MLQLLRSRKHLRKYEHSVVDLLINARGLRKSFGAVPLFEDISISIFEGGRLGLIGPNGSGKSTLLGILAGTIEPDAGEVAVRKNTRLAYVAQQSEYRGGETVRDVLNDAWSRAHHSQDEKLGRIAEIAGRVGFTDLDGSAAELSGGWRKRLAIAEALIQSPDVLLLDEPTNHLDMAGIEWLETFLNNARLACVVISHDRYFLENTATEMAELNRVYREGILHVDGGYSAFLVKKAEFLAAQAKRQEALENRVRTEIEWLRRGPKARATKAKARIDNANEMIGELAEMNSRNLRANANIDFTPTARKTKRLIEFERVRFGYTGKPILSDFGFTLLAGMRVGLVGPNGSGKTTLLRLFKGELEPEAGEIRRADALRIVYFDQKRELNPALTLKRALSPHGDSVIFQDRPIHVASWAARFLFTSEQLEQPVAKLSGGERARVLIAQLMLQPADVLLLDEPTNDLDIPTLEVLEESLDEFAGALVLITHDRYMLDRVSTIVLGLDGLGEAGMFADYAQWESWRDESNRRESKSGLAGEKTGATERRESSGKKKLSYLDSREYAGIEGRIAEAEAVLEQRKAALQDPSVVSDGRKIHDAYREMELAQAAVDALYARWAELEEKISSIQ